MYVVRIKSSARRINRAAGEYLAYQGATRRFEAKSAARAWATEISDGDGAVRVQDAAPNDPADVDGYLVADPVRRRSGSARGDAVSTMIETFDGSGLSASDDP